MQERLTGSFGYPRILWLALRAVRVLAVGLRRTGGGIGSWESWVAVLCLVAVLVPLSGGMSPSWAQSDGELRVIPLAETDAEYEGRLEIYHIGERGGEWGGICDDFWGIADARVACRQLGYQDGAATVEALRELTRPTPAPIWLDNVNCAGSEAKLADCDPKDWGPHNPHHCSDQGEYAGVRCTLKDGNQIVFNKRHLTVDEQGSAVTYQVWLSEMPAGGDVTVTISGFDGTDVTLKDSMDMTLTSLTFTTTDWEDPQTVTVTAGDDADKDDDTVTLAHTASGGGYNIMSMDSEDVTVTVKDNDVPGVSVTPKTLPIDEGDTASYEVVLTVKPADTVTIIVSGYADPSVSVDSTSLMFTTSNWDTAQTVTVTAEQDTDSDSETVTLTHSASGGGYGSVSIDSVTVRVQDDDEARKPGQVARPTVTGQSTTDLEVSWAAPANNGAAITAYEVEYRQSGTNTLSTRTLTGITSQPQAWRLRLTDLLSGTTYEVRVRAMNREGYGAWSASGTRTTLPAPPGAPTVTAESVTRLHVEWDAQAAHEVAITGYDVQYRQVGTPDWERWDYTGSDMETTITGLRAGTGYYVQVRAKNAGGASAWSSTGSGITHGNTDNMPVSGQPTLSGTARVGETLTADISGIMDPDGLTNVTYIYQWVRVDGSDEIDIAGATSNTYTLTAADEGKQVKVRVRFTDDKGTDEAVVSDSTGVVAAAGSGGSPGGGGGSGGSGGSGGGGGNGGNSSGGGSGGTEGRGDGSGSGDGSSEALTGHLENPGPASFQSGIGVISGWVCEADTVEIELNGEVQPAAYGTERADTQGACGDTDNGFGILFNWNLLGDGEHEVVAQVDGVEFARTTVTVTTLGAEFLRDVSGGCTVADFPSVGESVRLVWQEASQSFVLAEGAAPTGPTRSGIAGAGFLENPSANSFQSGIGVLSGWVCAAGAVTITLGDLAPQAAGYGTERVDTLEVCGDTDNGFGLLFNWNLLGDGEHVVIATVDGTELARTTVRVTTLGEEFVRDAVGECVVADFPRPGETVTLTWQETSQNFVITDVE